MGTAAKFSNRASTIPGELSSLLGRGREAHHLQSFVLDPAIRLVTITGPECVGKIRLAIHVASTLINGCGDDVVFVPLASVREPSLVFPTIGQVLDMFGEGQDTYINRLIKAIRG